MEKLFNNLIIFALQKNCSDIHLDFDNKGICNLSYRLKGQILPINSLNNLDSTKLINYILFKANLDLIDMQTLHTGVITYLHNDKEFYLRVSVVFVSNSKSVVIRVLNNHQIVNLSNLGVIHNNIEDLKRILNFQNGLVIFTGKTGAGKTTTMYALIEELKKQKNRKIITLEDPVERQLEGVLQVSVNNDLITYFDVLKQVLRHDPDIIVIGEIRDENDLKLAIQASLSGHLVITSMHAISALFAVNRLIELNVSKSDLKACLQLISYQELLYSKTKQPFSIYEFINNKHINLYLENKGIVYYKVNDYKQVLKGKMLFYEGK